MRTFILPILAAIVTLSAHLSSLAAQPAAVDCYALLSLEKFKPAPSRELVILIDETTVFTPEALR